MTLHQQIEWLYDQAGDEYPVLRVRADGVHDVGRLIATLARGNVEHSALAHDAARGLNRTPGGRATLRYLERHGGPKLAPPPCEECEAGNHSGCHQLEYPHDPVDGAVCGCFEAEEIAHG